MSDDVKIFIDYVDGLEKRINARLDDIDAAIAESRRIEARQSKAITKIGRSSGAKWGALLGAITALLTAVASAFAR